MLVTRCPHCETAFRIQAAHLEQAEGHVRCGRCSNVFDAYQELRQSLSPTLTDLGPAGEDPATPERPQDPDPEMQFSAEEVEQLERALDGDEVDAEAISAAVSLGTAPTVTDEQTPPNSETEAPTEGPGTREDNPNERLEFNLPADQWDEFFSDTVVGEGEVPDISDTGVEWVVIGEREAPDPEETPAADDPPAGLEANSPVEEPPEEATPEGHVMDLTTVAAATPAEDEPQPERFPDEATQTEAPRDETAPDEETLDEATADEATLEETLFGELEAADLDTPPPTNYWQTAAALLLVVGLCAQYVHYNRQTLATHSSIGPRLVASYERLGIELSPAWDLGQYQINRWVAASDTSDEGKPSLKITAQITNRGPKPQPFPLVQLALKDRWDETVAGRVFEPTEYLSGLATSGLLGAGEHIQAQLKVLDPGQDAYGFELDVCIRARGEQLRCANEPQRR